MGQPRVKWGQVESYCNSHDGFSIRSSGGEKFVIGPEAGTGKTRAVRIGHTSCASKGTEMLRCYVSNLKRVFGISIDDLTK